MGEAVLIASPLQELMKGMFHVKQLYNSYAVGLAALDRVQGWTSGIDALSQVLEGEGATEIYDTVVQAYKNRCLETGEKFYRTKVGHYDGVRFGPVFCGTDRVRYYVSSTGETASDLYALCVGQQGYYTRIDVQITVKLKEPDPEYVERQYKKWTSHSHGRYSPSQAKFVQSSTGSTLYLGNRTSERMYRLYDKSSWFDAAVGTYIRFEVQDNKRKSTETALTIADSTNMVKCIGAIVFGAYHKADIRVPVELVEPPSVMEVTPKFKDREHYLNWLKTSVQPVVANLRYSVEDDRILECLGLQRPLDL